MDENIEFSQLSKIVDEINTEATSTVHDSSCSSDVADPFSEDEESLCSPALLNEIVLKRVFEFLAFDDLKSCRFVCLRWNAVAEPVLLKRSFITLTPAGKKTFSELKMVFQNELPLENLKLQNSSGFERPLRWDLSKLDEVLDYSENKIKSLELYINFSGSRPAVMYELRPEIQCNLTTLTLHCRWSKVHNMRVSLDHLTNIKVIRLLHNVILDTGAQGLKIAPREIDLQEITFYSNGSKVDKVVLNNLIDFRAAKTVRIWNSPEILGQKLFLDMRQSIKLYSLDLGGVEILEGSEAKWNIEGRLLLYNTPWIQRNQMKFTSLEFMNGTIDISTLPSTLERLQLTQMNELSVDSSQPVLLTNLKFLSLNERRDATTLACLFNVYSTTSCLRLFKNCMKVTAVYLNLMPPIFGPRPTIDLDALPTNVRELEIEDPYFVGGYGFHQVTKLILRNWPINKRMLEEMRKFGARKIVVDSRSWGVVTPGYVKKCMKMIGYFQRLNPIDFFLGPVEFPDSSVKYYYKNYIGEHFGSRIPRVISERELQEIREYLFI